MRIGALADRAGVSAKTIRFYEQAGLLDEPPREPNGYRDYGDDALARLEFVRAGQAIGFSLDELRTLVTLRADGRAPCAEAGDLLRRRLREIDERLLALQALRRDLQTLLGRADALDPADCDPASVCHVVNPSACPCPAH